MQFDLVIFDCDGVLIDSEMLSVRADIAERGIELSAEEILDRYTGISLAGMLSDLETRFGRTLPGFGARHRLLLEQLFEADLQPIPGVSEVLDSLPGPRCVASSSTPERLRHALSLVRLFDRFHPNIFSATDVARGKPAPDLFLHAAARMGVAPERCVVIEDSLPGIAAALAAGMTAIGFTAGGHCRPGHASRLEAEGAALVAAIARAGAAAAVVPARIETVEAGCLQDSPERRSPQRELGVGRAGEAGIPARPAFSGHEYTPAQSRRERRLARAVAPKS